MSKYNSVKSLEELAGKNIYPGVILHLESIFKIQEELVVKEIWVYLQKAIDVSQPLWGWGLHNCTLLWLVALF